MAQQNRVCVGAADIESDYHGCFQSIPIFKLTKMPVDVNTG
jgi:hypothetical protein